MLLYRCCGAVVLFVDGVDCVEGCEWRVVLQNRGLPYCDVAPTDIYNKTGLYGCFRCLKKNLKAFRPSEHPSLRGKMSKRLGGIIGCK